jgi:glycosyltransferase involved in cell wall biosynthesis
MSLYDNLKIAIIIPAYNEAHAIAKVIAEIPSVLSALVLVIDNNSTDETAEVAIKSGATVLTEKQQGYGNACLCGLSYLAGLPLAVDIVIFLDADYSDYPVQMLSLIAPIINKKADLVIGSRVLGRKESGSMTIIQRFGNWLATKMIYFFYRVRFTDLGPFRAMDYPKLIALDMQDRTYGWTVEMQVKAAKLGYRCEEVAVDYRRRIGISKISGTIKGVVGAGYKIISTILKYR